MSDHPFGGNDDVDPQETLEWIESLESVVEAHGPDRARFLLERLLAHGAVRGAPAMSPRTTPYVNTIPREEQPPFPGNRDIERRIKSLARWNAMSMVVRANRHDPGIGGHISTYASAANLLEVGFNHFFRARTPHGCGDIVYFQGHASPGIYARAFLEGRISAEQLENFRHELAPGGGLSSYPHPRLMPDFWEYPTVSMGLGPITAIYQARFNRYLENRGLKACPDTNVWCFVGDGETDEPESLGALTLAAREGLDNLIFVVNCNLQRLDGPVRGNGKIIQELEAAFRGAGWNVIKVVWGDDWDELLARDDKGLLVERMNRAVDGDYQNYSVRPGSYTREHFFGTDPELRKLVEHLPDEKIQRLRRGGHDPEKVYAAFKAAVEHREGPTVILAKTIKGYGLGEGGEGRNITHSQKKLNEEELKHFRDRFNVPISDEDIANAPFYKPDDDSDEIRYLKAQRRRLGGFVPTREVLAPPLNTPDRGFFAEFMKGSGDSDVATTMVYTRMLSRLLKHETVGKLIVPIIPDEARTFGMDALFRQAGIYASRGQVYEPVDSDVLLYYKEAKDGQILEEGITEAGSTSSFIAAGTAYATHGITTIPFYTFYSMFGFQRIGDLVWAAADARCRGFLMGATAGRTTLAGEGLQHQDGHSHLFASTVPCVRAYDPAFGYELALIVQDGMRRMYKDGEDLIYYITLYNEKSRMPDMPKGVEEGVIKGLYRYRAAEAGKGQPAQILASGPMVREALAAQELLAADHQCTAGYPAEFEELNLRVVTSFRERFPDIVVGLSSHDNGIAMAVAAYMLGARIVEKHFTLNHTWKGTDHAFSLEPIGFKKMVRDLQRTKVAIGDGVKRTYESEVNPIIKMGKKIVAARDLPEGYTLRREDLALKSPGDGLAPYELEKVIGRVTLKPLSEDDDITFDVLNGAQQWSEAAAS